MAITPPTLAKQLGVKTEKIHTWIKAGELRAVNVATRPNGQPRWVIMPDALADFLTRRSAVPTPKRQARAGRKAIAGAVKKYF